MKIAWFCIPAHGHTNPTLAVVRELTKAGHEVYYFSFAQFREKLEAAGAVFIPCDDADLGMDEEIEGDKVGKDLAYATELMVNATLALDNMAAEKIKEIKPDLIVSDSVAHWGKLTALKYGIPFVSSTTTFAFNKYSSRYMKQSIGSLFGMLFSMPKINRQLKRLQENGYPVKSVIEIIQNDNATNTIVYTSKYFQPCSDTFSDKYHFIGSSIRPIEQPIQKKRDKLIYISLGTVNKNAEFYRSCLEAVRNMDAQVIISTGAEAVDLGELPEHIEVYPSVDQIAVLSQADAFVTHCGMNSVSEALSFEVPLVLCPQTPEQRAVAARTAELGAGIELKRITSDAVQEALQKLLQDDSYRKNAAKIAKSFRSCGGAAEARAFLESICHGGAK